MRKSLTWTEKYRLAISENLDLKGIMALRDCGRSTAEKIRKEAIAYCLKNNIEMYSKYVPTSAVLIVTKKDIAFYYEKMVMEAKILAPEEA